MIRLIEALNFRCLRYVRQPLGAFHVLVGPNASGKTTFLDVLPFLRDLMTDGVEAAVARRTSNFHDLVWGRQEARFELAVEALLPEDKLPPIDGLTIGGYAIRYELAVGLEPGSGKLAVLDEQVLLTEQYETTKLPSDGDVPRTLCTSGTAHGAWRPLISRSPNGSEYWLDPEAPGEQTKRHSDGYRLVYRPGSDKGVLRAMSEGEFPSGVWLEEMLRDHVIPVDLDSPVLRQSSRPGQGGRFASSGANLPWLVGELQVKRPAQYAEWIAHLRTALPEMQGIRIVERPEDRHRYIMVQYRGGLEVPSWMLSDGTLRIVAITLLAYHSAGGEIYLIEEPETHLHPLNIEVAMQSLSSVYDGQVLVATHSPAVLAMTDVDKVLAFSRDAACGTRIVSGDQHPRLRDWRGGVSLGTLFAGGVLG